MYYSIIIKLSGAAVFVATHWTWFLLGGLLWAACINGRRSEQWVLRDSTLPPWLFTSFFRAFRSDLALYLYAGILGITAAVTGLNSIDLWLQNNVAADANAVAKQVQWREQYRLQERCSQLVKRLYERPLTKGGKELLPSWADKKFDSGGSVDYEASWPAPAGGVNEQPDLGLKTMTFGDVLGIAFYSAQGPDRARTLKTLRDYLRTKRKAEEKKVVPSPDQKAGEVPIAPDPKGVCDLFGLSNPTTEFRAFEAELEVVRSLLLDVPPQGFSGSDLSDFSALFQFEIENSKPVRLRLQPRVVAALTAAPGTTSFAGPLQRVYPANTYSLLSPVLKTAHAAVDDLYERMGTAYEDPTATAVIRALRNDFAGTVGDRAAEPFAYMLVVFGLSPTANESSPSEVSVGRIRPGAG